MLLVLSILKQHSSTHRWSSVSIRTADEGESIVSRGPTQSEATNSTVVSELLS